MGGAILHLAPAAGRECRGRRRRHGQVQADRALCALHHEHARADVRAAEACLGAAG